MEIKLARQAMASRFELILQGEDAVRLRAAGEEALAEISRLEAQLSFYRPSSDISRINARAAEGPVRVEPRLFRLLQQAKRLYEQTGGAFDITVAPLMRCWGFVNDTGRLPDPDVLAEAQASTGMHLVTLDEHDYTVSFARPGVMLDLGAIGKGYAIDEAVQLLLEAGVTRAFLHGGTSTIYALGRPLEGDAWRVALPYPGSEEAQRDDVLAVVSLEDEALSVSAEWGKSFVVDEKTYGHVLDPRVGRPVEGALMAAAVQSSAAMSDALSTAFLVLGRDTEALLEQLGGETRALVLSREGRNGQPWSGAVQHGIRLT